MGCLPFIYIYVIIHVIINVSFYLSMTLPEVRIFMGGAYFWHNVFVNVYSPLNIELMYSFLERLHTHFFLVKMTLTLPSKVNVQNP